MNKHSYEDRLTEEDILAAERKFPLADVSTFKVVLFMLSLATIMFIIGVFIL